jgi:hypothetical protein
MVSAGQWKSRRKQRAGAHLNFWHRRFPSIPTGLRLKAQGWCASNYLGGAPSIGTTPTALRLFSSAQSPEGGANVLATRQKGGHELTAMGDRTKAYLRQEVPMRGLDLQRASLSIAVSKESGGFVIAITNKHCCRRQTSKGYECREGSVYCKYADGDYPPSGRST